MNNNLIDDDEKDDKENYKENIDFALDISIKKLDKLENANTAIESKIGILLGFVGVIVGGVIALLATKKELLNSCFFISGLLSLGITFTFLIFASKARKFLDPPAFDTYYSKKAFAMKNLDLKNQVVADIISCYESNLSIQKQKARNYNYSLYCFIISLVLLFAGVVA